MKWLITPQGQDNNCLHKVQEIKGIEDTHNFKTFKQKQENWMREEREFVTAKTVYVGQTGKVSSMQVTVVQHVTRNLTTHSWFSEIHTFYIHTHTH